MKKSVKIPPLRKHSLPGRPDRAYASFNSRRIYFGEWGKPETVAAYNQYAGEWLARGCAPEPPPQTLCTVAELADAFMGAIERDYGRGSNVFEKADLSCKALVTMYGMLPCVEFTALSLKAVQESMINAGLCLSTINARIALLKRAFRHGVETGMIPGEVHYRVAALSSLRAGRTRATPPHKRHPVPVAHVEMTLPYLPSAVALCVRLMTLTGARCGELLGMRKADIDRTDPACWVATISEHKTRHHNKERHLYFGPRAIAILRPVLLRKKDDEHIISPLDSIADHAERRREETKARIIAAGKDPETVQIGRRENQAPSPRQTDRRVGDLYNKADFARAIRRGIERLNADLVERGERAIPFWSSHQIRHAFATQARSEFGLEAAKVLLGHSTLSATQIYAEADQSVAKQIISKIG